MVPLELKTSKGIDDYGSFALENIYIYLGQAVPSRLEDTRSGQQQKGS